MFSAIARTGWPLFPAWLISGALLAFSPSIWIPGPPTPGNGDPMADGWFLIGTLVVGTATYALAPVFGPMSMVVTPSSSHHSFGRPTAGQEHFGTGVMRALALLSVYVIVCAGVSAAFAG
jgi:hypothetical protein